MTSPALPRTPPACPAPAGPDLDARRACIVLPGLLLTLGAAGLACCSAPPAPEVSYTLMDGRSEALSALRGKVVLVNFWATSCASCVAEMPDLAATHQRFKARGYETVAVAMAYDPPAFVLRFAQSRALPFKVALDHDGAVARAFGEVQLTPTTVLIDKQGRMVKRYVGPPSFDELNARIEKLLAA